MTVPSWWPAASTHRAEQVHAAAEGLTGAGIIDHLEHLAATNRRIHDLECVNLNPATNVMNPRAEALQASGLGSRPSLGLPGDKYEMGLEAIEAIEVLAAGLASRVFRARFAEVRVASGAMANLYAFLATCRPGDTIIAPPAAIGGHVTHQDAGCAGLFGLRTVPAPALADGYTVDADALRAVARRERPRLITVGGSLNLHPHPVAELRLIADEVGAHLLFDAAHLCGLIAGGAWPDPLAEGAHLMTMSTYKSFGGPAGGLVLTDDADLARRLDAIAYPGLTANFDVGRVAALAVSLVDWVEQGAAYAAAMVDNAASLAAACHAEGLDVFTTAGLATASHQFALRAIPYGGGQAAARRLRQAGILTCGIGLPDVGIDGDVNGLRLGTPEITRRGMKVQDMPVIAEFLARGLDCGVDPTSVAAEVADWRAGFTGLSYVTPPAAPRA